MVKKISLFIFGLLLTQVVLAQEKLHGGSGGFYLGGKQYNTNSYNYYLADGVDGLQNNLVTIGGGGYTILNNWMLGGYGFYRGGERKDVSYFSPTGGQDITYSLNGGGGYLTLGYVVFHTDRLIVFPQAGLGLESLGLSKTLNEDVTFRANDNLSAEYSWSSPMLDLGAGIDLFPTKKGLKIGLRAGYNLSLQNNNDWRHAGGELISSDLPENDLDGFYINLIVGGGGIGTR